MGATVTGSPRIQAEQRAPRACLGQERGSGSGSSSGPALPILRWGGGGMGRDPQLTFSPRGLSHFLCPPCPTTSHR